VAASVARALTSFLVPPLCVSCREPEFSGSAVCPPCAGRLVPLDARRCLRCGAPAGEVKACRECRGRRLAFDRAWAPFAYEGISRRLVSALKARGATSAASFMGTAVAARAPEPLMHGTLVPVPAHPSRHRRHGFNQAAELARAIGRAAGLPVADILVRDGKSRPQVGLERRARLSNAGRSVRASRWLPAPPGGESSIVLVDDVYTTGATLDACARALRQAGAERVVALTFARTIRV
jgi:ComF family protein